MMTSSAAIEKLKKLREKRDKRDAGKILKELPRIEEKGAVAISISKKG